MEGEDQSTGPFVSAAVICEKVLQEKDNVVSLIRIIDRLTHVIQAQQLPTELPKVPYQFVMFLSFKSGAARGRHQLEVVSEDPSGQRKPIFSSSLLFEGEDRGGNVLINVGMEFDKEGLYWFDVLLDGRLSTRMPFRMMFQLVSTGSL